MSSASLHCMPVCMAKSVMALCENFGVFDVDGLSAFSHWFVFGIIASSEERVVLALFP